MPVYTIDDLTGWKHLPIDGIVFFYDATDDLDNKVVVRNILEGATWSLNYIKSKAKDFNGVPVNVGLSLKGSITLLENDISIQGAMTSYMSLKNPQDILIKLKGDRGNAGDTGFRFDGDATIGSFNADIIKFSDNGIDTKVKIDFYGRTRVGAFTINPLYEF